MPSALASLLRLPSVLLLALNVPEAFAGLIQARQDSNGSLQSPIYLQPSGGPKGIDGSWFAYELAVGTPAQNIYVFPSFSSYQILAVLPEGCQGAANTSACATNRGGLYNETASTTFREKGIFDWGIAQNTGVSGNAVYGFDKVVLEGIGSAGNIAVQNLTVGGFAVADPYLGVLGLNPRPTNFSSPQQQAMSLMTLLREQNLTASVSAAYTAGASYLGESGYALGSLTLGGYDSRRVGDTVLEVNMTDGQTDLVVAVTSISTPSQNSSNPVPVELLPGAIYATIDPTFAEIWLPLEACRVFEYEFGLQYDNKTELYLVNETLHTELQQRNASIIFQLGVDTSGGDTIQITLPYAAFDLTASPPYSGVSNSTQYFPLRRAANSTQYTIGRTFMQEAYLSVNWESAQFNISQAVMRPGQTPQLVALPPTAGYRFNQASPTASASSSAGLSAGAIAGVVVGSIVALVMAGLLAFWFLIRRRRAARARAAAEAKLGDNNTEGGSERAASEEAEANVPGRRENIYPKAELPGSEPAPPTPMEETGDGRRLVSSHGSLGVGTNGGATFSSGSGVFGNTHGSSSACSPSTPIEGEGTHSSSQSESNATSNTHHSPLISPLDPSGASQAGSLERQIHEMPGDMPTIKEKDGKALSEKEAMQHRERIYNGVDTPPRSAVTDHSPSRERRLVSPEEVQQVDTLSSEDSSVGIPPEVKNYIQRRAFSFEENREEGAGTQSSDEFYRRD